MASYDGYIFCLLGHWQHVSEYQLQRSSGGKEVCLSLLLVGFAEATGGPFWERESWTKCAFGLIKQCFSYILTL